MELLTRTGLEFGFRWLHILFGITWIGLLYYFNLVQVPAFAAYGDEGKARNIAIQKVASRALWWFRWAAVFTLGTGLLIIGATKDYMVGFMKSPVAEAGKTGATGSAAENSTIFVGMVLGITMAANVWMVIWKHQKTVIANAANVLGGGEANAAAPAAGRAALLASRQNFVFSLSMLFFMVGTAHFYDQGGFTTTSAGSAWAFVLIALLIALVMELNCLGLIGGKANTNKLLWPYESHKNAMISAGVLWLVLWLLSEILLT